MIGANSLFVDPTLRNPSSSSSSSSSSLCSPFNSGSVQCSSRIQRRRREVVCVELGFLCRRREGKWNGGRIVSMDCFKGRKVKKERKMEVERFGGGGGEEIWDAAEASQLRRFPEHLVIMVNGIVGSAEDWRYAAEQFVKKLPEKVIVHRECNSSKLTFDGVDLMGERLAEEVSSVVSRRPGVQKISFVAHSLGGLIARYAIGRLYENSHQSRSSVLAGENSSEEQLNRLVQSFEQPCEGRIAGLEPFNFITFATPHLGSRGNKQLPFLCGLPFLERRASQTAHWIVGRTGKHLFLTDNDNGSLPLLLRMVNDCGDLKYMLVLDFLDAHIPWDLAGSILQRLQAVDLNRTLDFSKFGSISFFPRSALRSFKRRVAYANANYDPLDMVGWRTSSIRRQNELPQSHLLEKNEKYPHIVHVELERSKDVHIEAYARINGQTVELEGLSNSSPA
ncbi:hypothetical protein Scep_023368 [Stephania cephalantha]|uniref:DUF676 domain-containing protein n=1 Tax=Stephania cephalantha TaxID=152367 RepID=A0AAP0F1M6_9MAGN